jgi:hypothetical protein
MVWDPARITPRPWGGVVEFYRHLEDRNADFRPMRLLAERLASRAEGLPLAFAATSGTALLVVARSGADWVRDGLRIDVDLAGGIRFFEPGSNKPRVFGSEIEPLASAVEAFVAAATQAR